MKYIGQTDGPSKKDMGSISMTTNTTYGNPSFATHLLDHEHSIGPVTEIMEILHTTKKGRFMDTIEKFHIYRQTQLQHHINDKHTVKPNAIFDLVCSHDPPLTTTP
jgi:hypothetical protein